MIPSVLASAIYFGILLVISYQDYKHRRIPNNLLVCLLILRAIFLAVFFVESLDLGIRELLSSGIAFGITLIVLLLFWSYLKGKTGAGDMKLLLVCGFCLGINRYLLSLLFTAAFLVATYIFQLIRQQKNTVPFAPYLSCGMLVASLLTHISL